MHLMKSRSSIILFSLAATAVNGFTAPNANVAVSSRRSSSRLVQPLFSQAEKAEDTNIDVSLPESNKNSDADTQDPVEASEPAYERPQWMNCINGIAPRSGPLNEAVSKVAGVSLEQANDLIAIGAVWAKMDFLTEDEVLDQYYGSNDNAKITYSDLPSGWHSDRYEREEADDADLEEFIERMESRRYTRIMSPSTIASGDRKSVV